MRAKANNEFEKDFFKLMNNSVFGKTMEDVKNRMKLYLTCDDEKVKKWTKLHFKQTKEIEGLYMIEMFHQEVLYNKPVYIGATILDLSKLCMMDFHYNVIQKNFENRYNLIYTDTDSLIYQIYDEDVYDWVKKNKHHFDLSDSLRPELKNNENKKVLGKFKDEMHSLLICETTALNPKVYSNIHQKLNEDNEIVIENKKICKGVSKSTVKNDICNDDYLKTLETNKILKTDVVSLRSFNHIIYTHTDEKVALTSFYDKQVMQDSINCVPFGYEGDQVIIN
jgi:hypothetical protein